MEIPLVFPLLEASPRRFVVNDTAGMILEDRGGVKVASTVEVQHDYSSPYFAEEGFWRAAASASTLREGIATPDAVLTTSLLPEEPGVLTVSLVPSSATSSPILLELDLGSQTSKFGSIVKVQAFYWNRPGHPTTIALLLVDVNAVVMRIVLDSITLSPSTIDLWDITEMLAAKVGSEYASSANLCSSMVVPLTPTSLLLAPNPFLLAVDLSQDQLYLWSKSKVLEEMKARASTFGTLLKHGVDLVLGKVDHNQLVDMHPVSALCVTDNDPRQVVSLHSDGVVRHWKLEPQQPFEPWSVHEPPVQGIPSPDYWKGSDPFCLTLLARVYDQTLSLAIHIHTHGSSSRGDDDDNPLQANGHSLVVYRGRADGDDETASHSMRLKVPSSALYLIGLSFDVQNPRCSLLALFSSMQTASAQYVTYPPSNLSIVGQDPIVTPSDSLLDGLAQQEHARLSRLSFYKLSPEGESLDTSLTQLDRRFLQFLFRPAFCRGTGLALPPLGFLIRRALNQVLDRASLSTTSVSTDHGLPVEVVQSLHAWRRQQTRARGGKYVEVPRHGTLAETEDQQGVNMEMEETPDAESVRDTLQAHERCWKQFLLAIWEQEKMIRCQLCMAPSGSVQGKRGIVVVRMGSVSVWHREDVLKTDSRRTRLSALDGVAAKVVQSLVEDESSRRETHHEQDCSLGQFEALVWNAISQGMLGVDPDVIEDIKAPLTTLTAGSEVASCLSNADRTELLTNVSDDELVEIIQDTAFQGVLYVLSSLETAGRFSATAAHGFVFNTQQRASAASLVLRSVDAIRNTLLGRLIALLTTRGAGRSTDMLLRMYIHSVTVLWTCAQQVDMRFVPNGLKTLEQARLQATQSGDASLLRPTKRQNVGASGSNLCSVLAVYGTRDRTTSLDALLINLSSAFSRRPERSSSSMSAVGLANNAFDSLVPFVHASQSSPFDVRLPELAAIPPASNAVTDEPKLAARLLAVYTSITDESDDEDIASLRKSVFAECLLIAAASAEEQNGNAMVAQALQLLPFDPKAMDTSLKHVNTVCHHLSGKARFEFHLTNYLEDAIDNTPSEASGHLSKLWSSVFVSATTLCRWDAAYKASIETPDEVKRHECLKRLVRTMVDAGGLLELLEMCVSMKGDEYSQVESLVKVTDMYAVAAETLAENSGRDLYSYLAVDPEPLSDYSGALYALHVSQEQWKPAAETLDRRYENARKALEDGPDMELGLEAVFERQSLIVDDMVLASLGCVLSMNQVSGSISEFLSTTPPASSLSPGAYCSKDELTMRSVLCVTLKKLFVDKLGSGKVFALSILEQNSTAKRNPSAKIIDQLFCNGYYREGLVVAQAQSRLYSGKPFGKCIFESAVVDLLCSFLVPLSTGSAAPSARPTLSQFRSIFETTSLVPTLHATLDLVSPGTKLSCRHSSAVRKASLALLHGLTLDFSTATSPLAVEVAESLIKLVPMPSWLEDFLMYGHGKTGEPGLFASRSDRETEGYRGDPSALLSLYTRNGMYVDACRLVSTVLRGKTGEDREKKATMRLPEKGDLAFVPYNKIDLLWNLIQIVLDEGAPTDHEAKELIAARKQMEDSLERHFEMLGVSEMGLTSARALL